jgi:hypothetical protein
MLDEWFDLTQPDFKPVFSLTVDGSEGGFVYAVGRTIHTEYKTAGTANIERIEVTLAVHFDGIDLDQPFNCIGVYERSKHEKAFKLVAAYKTDDGAPLSRADFADLADPFLAPSSEKLLAYALPGLRSIAAGPNQEARQWLASVLNRAKDSPEKRDLLRLLANR